jgi:hypothetical protein
MTITVRITPARTQYQLSFNQFTIEVNEGIKFLRSSSGVFVSTNMQTPVSSQYPVKFLQGNPDCIVAFSALG